MFASLRDQKTLLETESWYLFKTENNSEYKILYTGYCEDNLISINEYMYSWKIILYILFTVHK